MGGTWTKLSQYFKKEKVRLLLCGLDAAGRRSCIDQTKIGAVVTNIPTIGLNVEAVTFKNINITAWDVGGRSSMRVLWRHYYQNTNALVFVVDSHDRDRLEEAKGELHKMTSDEDLKDIPLLILANKQDLPNAVNKTELIEKLGLEKFNGIRKWHVQETIAITGQGLDEGFDWLASACTSILSTDNITKPITETVNDTQMIKSDLINSFWMTIKPFHRVLNKVI
ncbi:unnamed protein product [Didymodactylos carnosus]|uniref:ADP-ribosylation factor-like protein n=1 Tax=Didymodactylos carnosus TaxID=1234261 RepID=A0A813NFS1_9BILA|nr:unnamed protein product [Didymodactylos carnosus]CAF0739194.1 unnamed protein product [Didymodactylos carnosus]CAF3508906.1 unnamed protein product [Didymodactylos carnosus]CAF3517349.1 unnamed protein product [Didymodactylos carnosus]